MNMSHPIFGELVTSNSLIRGGRWVFRGTIVPLDDVFADFAVGLTLHEVWEKHGALDRRDLEAVATQVVGDHIHALRMFSRGIEMSSNGHSRRLARRAAA